ncbi:hypothetical protein EDD16DRAFT_1695864 [Pisolithus croceorrhizus]|nr:hypothetical protein EDD16DRAFT_1695864 [Pisolithus croceorrhizus]
MEIVQRQWLRRIRTADWVTPDILTRRRWVKGIVTSVGDADNFRLYHTPGIGWGLRFRRRFPVDLKDQTIHVRIAGVDAPEGGHFGRPSQPHAEESLLWLKNRLEGRLVYCQLIRKDQYGRVVRAEYGPWGREAFLRIEAKARTTRRGMWKYGCVDETPAEYKRRYAMPPPSTKQ